MKKNVEKKYNLSDFLFAGVAFLKENEGVFYRPLRSALLLAKAGIEFALLKLEKEKKPTKTRKIKIE